MCSLVHGMSQSMLTSSGICSGDPAAAG
jgi:hypothetical protein